MLVYGFILLFFFIGLIVSVRIDETQYLQEKDKLLKEKALLPFIRLSILIAELVEVVRRKWGGAEKRNRLREDIRILAPDETGAFAKAYQIQKVFVFVITLFCGTALAFVLSLKSELTARESVNVVYRAGYGEDSQVLLDTRITNGDEVIFDGETDYDIRGQAYSQEEVDAYFQSAREGIADAILGDNKDLSFVRYDLNLVKSLPDNPVQISWQTEDYETVDTEGRIRAREIPEEGMFLNLTARLMLAGQEEYQILAIKLFPGEITYEERLIKELREQIRERDMDAIKEGSVTLPNFVESGGDTLQVTYSYPLSDLSVPIFLLCTGLSFLLLFAKDRDLHKKVTLRNKEMARQYPELISKLVLLISAGMTIRGALGRITKGYQAGKKRKAAYEEIARICHEMETGVSEQQAYIDLGKRCEDPHYVRLSMLLSQNLMKGAGGLVDLLSAESREAFDERKRGARTLGEEASTKLLGPMMIMLLIVMVIIMVPAFFSFGA